MQRPSAALIEQLAAEFVLGTLRGRARARFARWLAAPSDSFHHEAQQAVRRWEDRLVHLADDIQPVDPAPRVWREIARRTRAGLPTRNRAWLGLAVAASVLFVAVGAWLFTRGLPGEANWQTAAELRDATQPLWRLEFDSRRDTLRATALRAPTLGAESAHELWALAEGAAAPVSLGLLPQRGSADLQLSATQRRALEAAVNVAVSREPSGGSRTGAPTGPVISVSPRRPLSFDI